MLLTKEVEIRLCPKNINHYNSKGYTGKIGDVITVKTEDLTKGSHIKVEVLCDYCKTTISHASYCDYVKSINDSGTHACSKCKFIKIRETNRAKYGFDYSLQNESIREKGRKSNLQKYGVENPMQSKEIKEKAKKTLLKKYGVENASQSEEIKKKKSDTFYERYGVTSSLQLDSVREAWSKSAYENGKVNTSKQQLYLHNLYGGELNYPISRYSADIYLIDEKIDIEYNGGGHLLDVKTGKITLGEQKKREYWRSTFLKSKGCKIMTIISDRDYLPSDEILLEMLEQARTYFTTTSHTWIEYNIDTSTMRNAENKDGIYFDYGDLRKIKEAS